MIPCRVPRPLRLRTIGGNLRPRLQPPGNGVSMGMCRRPIRGTRTPQRKLHPTLSSPRWLPSSNKLLATFNSTYCVKGRLPYLYLSLFLPGWLYTRQHRDGSRCGRGSSICAHVGGCGGGVGGCPHNRGDHHLVQGLVIVV